MPSWIDDLANLDRALAVDTVFRRLEEANGRILEAARALGITERGLLKISVRHGFHEELLSEAERLRGMREL